MKTIGRISFEFSSNNFDQIINGKYNGNIDINVRTVQATESNKNKLNILKNLRRHLNIQPLFTCEFENDYYYVAIKSYDITLNEYIKSSVAGRGFDDNVILIRGIAEGLKYLHENHIVHGNLCPGSIAIETATNQAVLCNIGFNTEFDKNFAAPEILKLKQNATLESDIFSMGCITFFVLSNGKFIFRPTICADTTTSNLKSTIFIQESILNSNIQYKYKCANFMIEKLISISPKDRPSCEDILNEPVFWNLCKIFNFLKELGPLFEAEILDFKNINDKKWIDLLESNCSSGSKITNESFTDLVKEISTKIKFHNNDIAETSEHMNKYLTQYPFLLPFAYNLYTQLYIKKRSNSPYKNESVLIKQERDDEECQQVSGLNKLPIKILTSCLDVQNLQFFEKSNSSIYSADWKSKKVVIKKILKDMFRNEEIKHNLELIKNSYRKCDSCNEVSCKHIIKCFGCYEENNHYCIIYEKAEMNFKEFILNCKNDSDAFEKILKIYHDACKGLGCLVSKGIAHLDIKPENILIVNRNGQLIGCLADFGESVKNSRGTLENIQFKGSQGYVAPEFSNAVKLKEQGILSDLNFQKCDIFGMGKVLINDCIGNLHASKSLTNLRKSKKINILCEELANAMVESDATLRPDAKGVIRNPFFWNMETNLEFLRAVHKLSSSHKFQNKRKEKLIKLAGTKMFISPNSTENSWLNRIKKHEEVYNEIKFFIDGTKKCCINPQIKKISPHSIFDLVDTILMIYDKHNDKFFPLTSKITDVENLQNYLTFWFDEFEIIFFLYYMLRDDLKAEYPQFYSVDTPKRCLGKRKLDAAIHQKSMKKPGNTQEEIEQEAI